MFTITCDEGAWPQPEILDAFKGWRVLITYLNHSTGADEKVDGVITGVAPFGDEVDLVRWDESRFAADGMQSVSIHIDNIKNLHIF